ncbi:MAG: hypothetical protein ACK41U_13900, partial [Paracoccus sp. (in: a-proteobacteria)]|uniref:hypothetical protein n=1 Tax=Paracoccus sp. TaxID=267 RepID=UPI003919B354
RQSLDAPSGHPSQNSSRSNRTAARLPGPSSVPAFGEAVFRPQRRETQAGFAKKMCQSVKNQSSH